MAGSLRLVCGHTHYVVTIGLRDSGQCGKDNKHEKLALTVFGFVVLALIIVALVFFLWSKETRGEPVKWSGSGPRGQASRLTRIAKQKSGIRIDRR